MAAGRMRFDRFVLDGDERRLLRDGEAVELNARYFDALALLVGEPGRLISKDRFLAEVWAGTPVTDEALTQCVRSLRRALGDDAARPRFIETVPKHGYRFIGEIASDEAEAPRPRFLTAPPPHPAYVGRERLWTALAGVVGGGLAGVIGGVVYGFAAASAPSDTGVGGAGVGAASAFAVLVCLTGLVGLVGGAGLGGGLALAGYAKGRPPRRMILGGALGGLLVGGFFKLVGVDAFTLLFGHAPSDITGAGEGLALGAAIGLGAWLAGRGAASPPLRLSMTAAGVGGGAAGVLIALAGGRLMGGSLDLLAASFPGSRLRLDAIAALFGEDRFGPLSLAATGALEGSLFGACVIGAMIVARRL